MIDLAPAVSGLGECIRGAKTVAIVAGAAGATAGAAKAGKALKNVIGETFEKAGKSSKKATADGFEEWLNKGKTDNKVYFGMKGNDAKYVGITKQPIETRLAQHNRADKNFTRLEIQYENLTRNQARAVEQYFIENGPNDMNQINSISPNNMYYQDAMQWAQQYIGKQVQ